MARSNVWVFKTSRFPGLLIRLDIWNKEKLRNFLEIIGKKRNWQSLGIGWMGGFWRGGGGLSRSRT